MVYFLIPFRSRHASKNWALVQKLFNATLQSVSNQTNPDFKIFVAYHDMPELFAEYKDNVEFIQMPYAVPQNRYEQMLDKYYKKRFLMQRIYKLGGGYCMMVDDDDLISSRIADFVNTDKHPNGYYVKLGYDNFYNKGKLKLSPKFHAACGSCCIINYEQKELPDDHFKFEGYRIAEKKIAYFFDVDHAHWVANRAQMGKPLKPLPFRAAIANINTSENYSVIMKEINRRNLLRLFLPGFKPTAAIRREFSIE